MQYKDLAFYYDKMIDIDYDSWEKFLMELFKKNNIETYNKTVLEFACGTGNMTLRLLNMGLKVIAIDASEEMLNVAKSKIKNKDVIFVNKDIRDIDFEKKFDMIFSFCDGFNYIVDDDELFELFGKVYNLLKKDGFFIFDLSSEYKLKKIIGNNSFTINEEEYCYIWDNYVDDDIIDMYITLFVKEGSLYRRIDEHHIQKAHNYDNIIKMLKEIGFNNIKTYDNYTFNDVTDTSQRITFVVQK